MGGVAGCAGPHCVRQGHFWVVFGGVVLAGSWDAVCLQHQLLLLAECGGHILIVHQLESILMLV